MGSFAIDINDTMGNTINRIESAVVGVKDFTQLFIAIQDAWIESRKEMFRTDGFGAWPGPTADERVIYIPYKQAKVGRRSAASELNVFDADPNSKRLFFSLTSKRSADFIDHVTATELRLGSLVPYLNNVRGDGQAPEAWGGYRIPKRDPYEMGDFPQRIRVALEVFAGSKSAPIGRRTADVLRGPIRGVNS